MTSQQEQNSAGLKDEDPFLTALMKSNDDEVLSDIRWHINRYDTLRSFTATRAAMVLSANALLLAGATFLTDKTLTYRAIITAPRVLVTIIGGLLAFVALSIYYAIRSAIVQRSTSEYLGFKIPKRLFFNASDTLQELVDHHRDLSDFRNSYLNSDRKAMIDYAIPELLATMYQYRLRNGNLRQAINALLLAVISFLVAIFLLLISVW